VSFHPLLRSNGAPEAMVGMFVDVTERRQGEAELEELRQLLQGVFDHAPVGQALFEAAPPYRVLAHNRIYQEYWDEPFRSASLVGRGVADYVPDAEAGGVLQVFREVAATGRARTLYDFPLDGLRRGRTYWHWHLSPVYRSGMVSALAHSLIEVTNSVRTAAELGRRVAEMAGELHHEVETLQSIIDHIPVMLVFYDRTGRFGMVNKAFEKRMGWSSEDLKTMDLMEGVYPDPEARAEARKFMLDLEPGWRDFVVRTREGTALESAWANVRLSDGSQIGIGIDISERKRAERQLRHDEERLALALEASQAGVFEYGLSGEQDTHQSPRFCEIFGIPPGQIPQGGHFRPWLLKWTQPEDRKRLERALSELEAGGTHRVSEEVAIRSASGRYIPVHLQARTLTEEGPAGSMASVVGVLRDLSRRKEIEQDLEEGRLLAEQRAQELQRLALELTESEERERRRVARVLHDELQQYLAAAKLKLSGLEASTKDELLHVARTVTELMDRAIAVSRSLSSELSPSVLYTAGLAAALTWLGDWMERQHGLAVEVRAEPAAEPQSGGVRILLFQAARELLFNVVKHSGVMEARLSLARDGQDLLVLSVSDRGRGFDRVRNGGSTSHGGFGLVSITERVSLLGGMVVMGRGPRGGAQIILSVPDRVMWTEGGGGKVAAETSAAPEQGKAEAATGPTVGSKPIRVLIADDHAVVREGFASLMQRDDRLEVVALASDGEMAVRLARTLSPDVVLMDVTMPQVNGVEATRQIMETNPEIRVIGLSIHDEKQTRKAMLDAGAADYLTKDGPAGLLLRAIYGASTDPRAKDASRDGTPGS
jgi:PAS domain S-box-containing protein